MTAEGYTLAHACENMSLTDRPATLRCPCRYHTHTHIHLYTQMYTQTTQDDDFPRVRRTNVAQKRSFAHRSTFAVHCIQ